MLQGCVKEKVWKTTSVIPHLGEHHLERVSPTSPGVSGPRMILREPHWGTADCFQWRGRWVNRSSLWCAGAQSK